MIRLYSGPLSLFSRKVEIALAEKGLAFEREMVPFTQADGYHPKHPEVLARNPKAQVPVLVDGDLSLFDSTVILEYLEDRYPAPPLYPHDAAARARCRLLELAADEIMLPPLVSLMYRTEPAHPDPAVQAGRVAAGTAGEAELRRQFADLERRLAHDDYLLGAYTAADIAAFMVVLYNGRLGGPSLRDYPKLDAWYARVAERPAVAPVVAEIAEADRRLSPAA